MFDGVVFQSLFAIRLSIGSAERKGEEEEERRPRIAVSEQCELVPLLGFALGDSRKGAVHLGVGTQWEPTGDNGRP